MLKYVLLATTVAVMGSAAGARTILPSAPDATISTERQEFANEPRPAWQADDPADSLYRAAREQLNRGDYGVAARSFARITEQFPKSTYAGDALYWQAFAHYSVGTTAELREAIRALDDQRKRYPKSSTRGDADALTVRVRGALARSGDSQSAESVAGIATQGVGASHGHRAARRCCGRCTGAAHVHHPCSRHRASTTASYPALPDLQ